MKANKSRSINSLSLSIQCPVCCRNIPADTAEAHANQCLDTANPLIPVRIKTLKDAFNLTNSPRSPRVVSSILSLQSTLSQITTTKPLFIPLLFNEYTTCPLCPKLMQKYTPQQKDTHVNKCLDSTMLTESFGIIWKDLPLCSSCDKPWGNHFTICSKLKHLKQCLIANGSTVLQVIEQVKSKASKKPKAVLITNSISSSIKPSISSLVTIPVKKKSATFDISSDEDFVIQKHAAYKQTHIKLVDNKNEIKMAKAMSLSFTDSIPLHFAEIITKKRKKPAPLSQILTNSPSKAYMDSKIKSLKIFAHHHNLHNKMNESVLDTSVETEGLRKLSLLPDNPYAPFFKPYINEICIKEGLTVDEKLDVGFRLETEYLSRITQTKKHYLYHIKQLKEEMDKAVDAIESELRNKKEQLEATLYSTPESGGSLIEKGTGDVEDTFATPELFTSQRGRLFVAESDQDGLRRTASFLNDEDSHSLLKAETPLPYCNSHPGQVIEIETQDEMYATEEDEKPQINQIDPHQHFLYSPLHSRHFSQESVSDDFSESEKENYHVHSREFGGMLGHGFGKGERIVSTQSTGTSSYAPYSTSSLKSAELDEEEKAMIREDLEQGNNDLNNNHAFPKKKNGISLSSVTCEGLKVTSSGSGMVLDQATASLIRSQSSAMLNAGISLPRNYGKLSHAQLKEIAQELGIRPGTKQFILSELQEIERLGLGAGPVRDEDLRERVHAYLKSRESVWSRIVRYEPLKVDSVHRAFSAEFKCTKKAFAAVLDQMGVHYIEEESK